MIVINLIKLIISLFYLSSIIFDFYLKKHLTNKKHYFIYVITT